MRAGLMGSCVLEDIYCEGSQSPEAEEDSGLGRERRGGEGDGGSLHLSSVTQAEEEFSKAQSVFEDLNQELLEELPVLYNR